MSEFAISVRYSCRLSCWIACWEKAGVVLLEATGATRKEAIAALEKMARVSGAMSTRQAR